MDVTFKTEYKIGKGTGLDYNNQGKMGYQKVTLVNKTLLTPNAFAELVDLRQCVIDGT